MKFQVITLFPDLIEAFTAEGVIGQARKKELISLNCIQLRDFTQDVHKTVDDRPFGGGDGMVMMIEPLKAAIAKAKSQSTNAKVIYLSPQGRTLDQSKVEELSKSGELILICGRYAGLDQRIINSHVDEEISIGDYVISGGELAASVLIDAVSRRVPGVLGHAESADQDSFSNSLNGLLEAPAFTRPREFEGAETPEVLLSGNHKKIAQWRKDVSVLVTLLKRPDLLFEMRFSELEKKNLIQFWQLMPDSEKAVLGLEALKISDFDLLEKGAAK